jgi:hypothetical protein
MRKITKRSAAVIAASAVAVVGAGAAWAAWSLNGSTTTTASAGDVQALDVTNASVTGSLVPGSVHDVVFTAANQNSFPVVINSVSITNVTADAGHPGCVGANNVKQAATTLPANDRTLAAKGQNDASKSFTLAGGLRMVADPSEACKGASFSITITLNAASTSATGQGQPPAQQQPQQQPGQPPAAVAAAAVSTK